MADLLRRPRPDARPAGEVQRPFAVVLAPTRELATQIGRDAEDLGRFTDLRSGVVIGGESVERQRRMLDGPPLDILIATPGRLQDWVSRGNVDLSRVQSLVLDEADRMVDMGFLPQVRLLLGRMPDSRYRQTMLFSATVDFRIDNIVRRWTKNPIKVSIEPEQIASDLIEQQIYTVSRSDKIDLLESLLRKEISLGIVFVNTRIMGEKLYERLRQRGIAAGLLSGTRAQNERERTLARFREGKIQVLVATDVASRGIHVDGVSHVINYDLPDNPEDYVHRIGRTGRAGQQGISIGFASEDDAFLLPQLEKYLDRKLPVVRPPGHLLERAEG